MDTNWLEIEDSKDIPRKEYLDKWYHKVYENAWVILYVGNSRDCSTVIYKFSVVSNKWYVTEFGG